MPLTSEKIFAPLNDYFDHIYVLTLKGYEPRQASIKSNLDGLNWSFFFGVDKRELDPNILNNPDAYNDHAHKHTKRTRRSMTLAEVACAMSHRAIYEDMLAKGYKRVLIFEDDVLPCFEKLAGFNKVMRELPNDWDMLMLGYYDEKRPTLRYKLQHQVYKIFKLLRIAGWHKVSQHMMGMMLMREFSEHFYHLGKAMGAHAYCVSERAAQKYVDYQTPVTIQADRIFLFYQLQEQLKAYMPKTPMFTLSELSKESSIQGKINR